MIHSKRTYTELLNNVAAEGSVAPRVEEVTHISIFKGKFPASITYLRLAPGKNKFTKLIQNDLKGWLFSNGHY